MVFIFDEEGFASDTNRIKSIQEYNTPKIKNDILGMTNY